MKAFFTSIILFLIFNFANAQSSHYQINVLDESSNALVLEFILNDYEINNISTGEQLCNIPFAAKLLKKGAPELLKISSSFILPDLAHSWIEVSNVETEVLEQINIAASKGNLSRQQNPNDFPRVKGIEYTLNTLYPASAADLNAPYILRDFRGQVVNFYPFQYDPITKKLIVNRRIEIVIHKNDQQPSINPFIRNAANQQQAAEFTNIYKRHFINFSSPLYTPISERGNMLIISHAPFIPLLDEFVTWKKQSGIKVDVVSVAQAGGLDPTNIKNFISNKYLTDGLTFVLLVGDHPQIPSFTSNGGASDPKYGFLVGDDSYPELIIGRVSAETNAHVITQLRRFIDYEKALNTDFNFLSKCMQISSEEGPGDNDEYDHEHAQLIRETLMNFTYDDAYEFYEGSQNGYDAAGNPNANMVKTAIDQGAGIINYTGHGSTTSWGTSGFNNNDISQLSNEEKLPFIWSVACVNGDFTNYTCFGEQWLRAEKNGRPIGAIGAFMSTVNQYWNPPMAGQDEMVNLLTHPDNLIAKRTFGGLSFNGCLKMNDLYEQAGYDMTETWHIFGDPSLMVRTAAPLPIEVTHVQAVSFHEQGVEVFANVENAFISLFHNNEIIGTGIIEAGSVYIPISQLANLEPILVTATAFNHIPQQSSIEIFILNEPFVLLSNFQINDIEENNNQLADYGETFSLNLNLSNPGNVNATGVVAQISSANNNIQILNNQCPIGTIQTTDQIVSNNCFSIKVNDLIPDLTPVQLNFLFTDDEERTWQIAKTMILNAPKPALLNYQLTEINGNGNNRPDAGELLSFNINGINQGNSTSPISSIQVEINNPLVTLNLNSIQTGIFATNQTVSGNFELQLDQSLSAGTIIAVNVTLLAGLYSSENTYLLKVGAVIDDAETNDFSLWPWLNSSNSAWFVDQNEKFEGESSFRSGSIIDNQSSTLVLNFTTSEDDSVSFYRKISSELDWDFLNFYINDSIVAQWSGLDLWKRFAFALPAGNHMLKWEYKKDEIISANADAAWIDFIELPISAKFETVDVKVIDNESHWVVYPNPNTGFMFIENNHFDGKQAQLRIFSINGKQLKSFTLNQAISSIALNDVAQGLYFYEIISADGKVSKGKFIITK